MYLRNLLLPIALLLAMTLAGCNMNELGLGFGSQGSATSKDEADPSSQFDIGLNFIVQPSFRKYDMTVEQATSLQHVLSAYVEAYEKDAAKGNPQKQYELGLMYLYGALTPAQRQEFVSGTKIEFPPYLLKTTKDLDKSVYWMEKAIRAGHKDAMFFYFLLEENKAVASYLPSIKKAIKSVAAKGNSAAKSALGLTYLHPAWGEESPETAIKYFKATPNEPSSTYGLGLLYVTNRMVTEKVFYDEYKGVELLKQAAKQGFDRAFLDLGIIYTYGFFFDFNFEVSLPYIVTLVEKYPFESEFATFAGKVLNTMNSASAESVYGNTIRNGLLNIAYLGADTSLDALKTLVTLSSNNRIGFNLFTYMYFQNLQADLNYQPGVKFKQQNEDIYRSVKNKVDAGDNSYALQLAFFYSRVGEDNIPNPSLVKHYALKAEDLDEPDNLDLLASLYLIGMDLPYDLAKATELFERSEAKGSAYAKQALEEIRNYQANRNSQHGTDRFYPSQDLMVRLLERKFYLSLD